jgi:hypothetical protein
MVVSRAQMKQQIMKPGRLKRKKKNDKIMPKRKSRSKA